MQAKNRLFAAVILTILFAPLALSQRLTSVRGQVLDAATDDALPYVSVQLEGTTLGTRTDIEGNFYIEARESGLTAIKVVSVGYQTQILPIKEGQSNRLTVRMEEASVGLQEITVRVEKYRNRGNPAVELIRKVIENKDKNRKESLDF